MSSSVTVISPYISTYYHLPFTLVNGRSDQAGKFGTIEVLEKDLFLVVQFCLCFVGYFSLFVFPLSIPFNLYFQSCCSFFSTKCGTVWSTLKMLKILCWPLGSQQVNSSASGWLLQFGYIAEVQQGLHIEIFNILQCADLTGTPGQEFVLLWNAC